MSSRERHEANQKLATIVNQRLIELKENPVKGTAIEEVGKKVYNMMGTGSTHVIPSRTAHKALRALALSGDVKNLAFGLLAQALQPGGSHPMPRKRQHNFRQRHGFVRR